MRAVAISLVAALGLVAPSAFAGESLRLVERAEGETVVHRSAAADALGDLIVFANPLYDAANQRMVGSSRGSCIRVEIGKWWDCHFTLTLKGGTLLVAGGYPDSGDFDLGLVGGTGRYARARGTLRVHARQGEHESYDFSLSLL